MAAGDAAERKMRAIKLAADAGISSSYISELEKSRRRPSKMIASQIARALGVPEEQAWEKAGLIENAAAADADNEHLQEAIKAAQKLRPELRDILYQQWRSDAEFANAVAACLPSVAADGDDIEVDKDFLQHLSN